MTRYEKMAVLISALALLVSLLSPIVSYFYFDASAKDYKYRATFVMGTSDGSGSECNWKKKGPDSCRVSIAFLVNNVGERPAESPQIAVQYAKPLPANQPIILDPPIEYTVKKVGEYHFYTLVGAVAPNNSLQVTFSAPIMSSYIYTKHGDKLELWKRP